MNDHVSRDPSSPYQIYVLENTRLIKSLKITKEKAKKEKEKPNTKHSKHKEDEDFYESFENSLIAAGIKVRTLSPSRINSAKTKNTSRKRLSNSSTPVSNKSGINSEVESPSSFNESRKKAPDSSSNDPESKKNTIEESEKSYISSSYEPVDNSEVIEKIKSQLKEKEEEKQKQERISKMKSDLSTSIAEIFKSEEQLDIDAFFTSSKASSPSSVYKEPLRPTKSSFVDKRQPQSNDRTKSIKINTSDIHGLPKSQISSKKADEKAQQFNRKSPAKERNSQNKDDKNATINAKSPNIAKRNSQSQQQGISPKIPSYAHQNKKEPSNFSKSNNKSNFLNDILNDITGEPSNKPDTISNLSISPINPVQENDNKEKIQGDEINIENEENLIQGLSSTKSQRSKIRDSYIDYLEQKKKLIREKWNREDQAYRKELEEEAADKSLMYIGTWKNFKFSNSPRRAKIIPEMKEEEEVPYVKSPVKLPPHPSENLDMLLQIPVFERLQTPKKNLPFMAKDNVSRSAKMRKTRKFDEDDFFTRQSQYENEKRRKLAIKRKESEWHSKKKVPDQQAFERLFISSIKEQKVSDDEENNIKEPRVKWTNDPRLVDPKKKPESEPPLDPSKFRDLRFNKKSQELANNDSRTFLERLTIEFPEVMQRRKEEYEERLKRERYNETYFEE